MGRFFLISFRKTLNNNNYMTAQELMIPRFEVIADYPYCPVKVNEQLEKVTETLFVISKDNENLNLWHLSEIEKLPHLFRKLNWWENRKAEDMPKQVICKAIPNDTEIIDIEEWDMDILVGWRNKEERTCCSLRSFKPEYGYFPFS